MMNHPLHPAAVHFPVVCWSLTSVGDLAAFLFDYHAYHQAVGVLLTIGCITGLVAMVLGLIELEKIKQDKLARLADRHMNMAIVTWSFYVASLFLRWNDGFVTQLDSVMLITSLLGFICLAITGWLGGNLVYQHGVGVKQKT